MLIKGKIFQYSPLSALELSPEAFLFGKLEERCTTVVVWIVVFVREPENLSLDPPLPSLLIGGRVVSRKRFE